MKYGEINILYEALNRLRDVTGFKVAWAVAKNIKILETEARFFNEQRAKLLQKYGTEEDGRVSIKTDDEKFPEFLKEFTELSDMEADVELYKISGDINEKDFHCDTATANDFILFMDYLIKEEEK